MYDLGDFESMHMTCREDAGSGFSQTAEFHILLWKGTKQSYYLYPSVSAKLGSGKKPSVHQPQLRQRESLWWNQLFLSAAPPLSFSFTASLPPNESVSPVRSEQ